MVEKFTLSVPDELAAKIKARRDWLGNLSQLFQETVAEKIQKKEEFEQRLKGDEDMEARIERLKREKAEAAADYFEKGKGDGLEWAKAAGYKELEYVGRDGFRTAATDRYEMWDLKLILNDPIMGDYFTEALAEDPIINPGPEDEGLSGLAEEWFVGWLEAVDALWQEVAPKL